MCSYWVHKIAHCKWRGVTRRAHHRAIRQMVGRERVCPFLHRHSPPNSIQSFYGNPDGNSQLCSFYFFHFGCLEAYEVDRCRVWNSFCTMAGISAHSMKFSRSRICPTSVLDIVSSAVITTHSHCSQQLTENGPVYELTANTQIDRRASCNR